MNNVPYKRQYKKPTSILKTLRNRKNRTALRQSTANESMDIFDSKRKTDIKSQQLVSRGAPLPRVPSIYPPPPNGPCVHKKHMFSPDTEPTIPMLYRSLKQYKSTKTLTTQGVPVSGSLDAVDVRPTGQKHTANSIAVDFPTR